MPYIIGFGMRGSSAKARTAEEPSAEDALELVRDLQRSEEPIRFIKAPSGYEVSVEELETKAKTEV